MSGVPGEDPARGERGLLPAIADAMVTLHKEQFGRGATRARAGFATDDTLVCTMEGVMHPAERSLTQLGQGQRVQETRLAMQNATSASFIATVEQLVGREVVAFTSALDPGADTAWELFTLGAALDPS